jgi:hypothetical protein
MFNENQGYRQCILCRLVVASSCFKGTCLQVKNKKTMSADFRLNNHLLGTTNTRVSSRKLISVFEQMVCSNISINAEAMTGSSPHFAPYLLNKPHPSSSTTNNSWSLTAAPSIRLHVVAQVHRTTSHFKQSSYS